MKRPDFRMLSLLIPATASAVGFFCFAVLAFSVVEMSSLSQEYRVALVRFGAHALAFGSEVGTLAAVVEIYRKPQREAWDWLALFISIASTFAAFGLSFTVMIGKDKIAFGPWFEFVGPLALALFAALDSYGGFVELGIYLRGQTLAAWYDSQRDEYGKSLDYELDVARKRSEHAAAMDAIAKPRETEELQRRIDELLTELRFANSIIDEYERMAPVDATPPPPAQNSAPLPTTGDESGTSGAPVATTPAKVETEVEPVVNQSPPLLPISVGEWREMRKALPTQPTSCAEVNAILVERGREPKPATTASRWVHEFDV